MIKVSGQATLKVPYTVTLNMTEEEFDRLTESKQNELLDNAIDWMDATRSADVDEIDVWDLDEVEE